MGELENKRIKNKRMENKRMEKLFKRPESPVMWQKNIKIRIVGSRSLEKTNI